MGEYQYLTDKLAEKILSRTERVENLSLCYNCKITDKTLQFISHRLSNLLSLRMKQVDTINSNQKSDDHNELLTEKVLAQLILKG